MIRRRHLMSGLAAAVAMPRLAAQTAVPVVCFLALATRQSDARSVAAFREGMRDLGQVEGRTYTLVEHYAEGDLARAELQLREQLAQGVTVFLTPGAAAVRLILRNTQSVPIVSAGLHPRGGQTDLFASLARPGGMVTGVSNFGEELAAKRVQLLREVLPKLATVGVLHNTTDPVFRQWGEETEAEIRAQGLTAVRLGLSSPVARGDAAHAARCPRARRRGGGDRARFPHLVVARGHCTKQPRHRTGHHRRGAPLPGRGRADVLRQQ